MMSQRRAHLYTTNELISHFLNEYIDFNNNVKINFVIFLNYNYIRIKIYLLQCYSVKLIVL